MNKVFQCYVPANYKTTREKLDGFFPAGLSQSGFIPVIEKHFPKDFIQLVVNPFYPKEYNYYVCLKPIDKIDKASMRLIHERNCLIQFYRTNEPDEIMANLFVQEI